MSSVSSIHSQNNNNQNQKKTLYYNPGSKYSSNETIKLSHTLPNYAPNIKVEEYNENKI